MVTSVTLWKWIIQLESFETSNRRTATRFLFDINNANFVSTNKYLNETSVRKILQLSTVLRYVEKKSGSVKERFVGFNDIGADC